MKKYILLTLPFSLFFLVQTNFLAIAAEEGTLKWAFQTDGAFSGHPAIGFDGTIYLCDWNGNFYAINPDGTQKWAFQIGESYNASPAIGLDGTIYIGEHENNKLHAINPDGTQKWEFITDKPCNGNPAIGLDGTIYVGAGKTYAINPDGTQKWAFETRWNPTIAMCPAIGADGTIYVKSWERVGLEEYPVFYAINPDGTQKWVLETGYEVRSSPAIGADGIIYVGGSDNRLHAINPDGTQKWAFKVEPSGNVDMSPTIAADGTIYVGAMSGVGPLYAINPDGTQKWAFETKLEPKRAMYPAIGADGTIYVKSWEGVGLEEYPVLYANNPDGTKKWVLQTGYEVRSSPAFGEDGTIYVGGSDNRLHAINPDGTQKWAFKVEPYGKVDMFLTIATDGTIYVGAMSGVGPLYAINPDGIPKWTSSMICTTSSPAIGLDGTIYVGSYDQNLYAINPDGTQKWSFETFERIYSSPVIAADGTIYVGAYSVPGMLYAINSSSYGLANSPWPMYGHDERHTGRASAMFADVPPGNWAEEYIYAIFNAGITKGCSQNPMLYCPKRDVTRDQMAAFLVRADDGEPPADYCDMGSPFSDVSPASLFCKYIKRLSELGITKGCGGDKYCPKTTVKRDQMAAFLVRAVEGEPDANSCDTGSPFSDVDPASGFCKYIKKLSELGITKGCGGGKYCPKTTVKRDQMAVFLERAFLEMD